MNGKLYNVIEIDRLVKNYKRTKDSKVLNELINAFEGFIIKYANFIKYGRYNPSDTDIQGMMKILSSKNCNSITFLKSLFEKWEYNDILNELKCLFIKSVTQFTKRDKGPFFVGYLYQYYKYMIKSWIRYLSKDVLNNLGLETIPQHYQLEDKSDVQLYENICLSEKIKLNQLEKYILYLHYGKRISRVIIFHRMILRFVFK